MSALEESKISEHCEAVRKMIDGIGEMSSAGKLDNDKFIKMVVVIIKAFNLFFAIEEKYMMTKGYKNLPSHREDHKMIIEILQMVVRSSQNGGVSVGGNPGEQISIMVERHFDTYDRPMMAYLEKVAS